MSSTPRRSRSKPTLRVTTLLLATVLAAVARADPAPAAPCRELDLGLEHQGAAAWHAVPISPFKRDTQYTLQREGGRTVLQARAERSASLYLRTLERPMQAPHSLNWAWKTDALVPDADNRDPRREDAPLRVVVAFDGDADRLPAAERMQRKLARALSGQPVPYATLMYIWGDQVAPETLIASAHTSQVKMLVVAAGTAGLGQWHTVRRDLQADYRRAFGEPPGALLAVGVMTDADNTGGTAFGQYADFGLHCDE